MAVIDELSPQALTRQNQEKKASAVKAMIELVEGSAPGEQLRVITDARAWVHTAFHTYRSAMADNDANLPNLARIEHDFIAALVALNFDDQRRQLRRALLAIVAFPGRPH